MKLLIKFFKIFFSTILTMGLLTVIGILYITYGERNLLVVKQVDIGKQNSDTKDAEDYFTIVQFTDSHLGEFYSLEQFEKAVNKMNEQKPDFVVFTGDLLDIASQFDDRDGICLALQKIEVNYGKYAVFGNRDYGAGGVRFYEQLMEEAGFTVLIDEHEKVTYGDRVISFYGSDDHLLGDPSEEQLMQEIEESDFNIFLMHEPDAVVEYEEHPIDFVLAGHSHGGQVKIPFYGALIKTNMCDEYFKGYYQLENKRKTELYVSSGLGNTKVVYRMGNIPEIIKFHVYFE